MQLLGAPAKKMHLNKADKLLMNSGLLQKIGVCPHERPHIMRSKN
jgi:hypothetical protein